MSRFTLNKWLHRPPSITIIRHWLAFSCSLTRCLEILSVRSPHFIGEERQRGGLHSEIKKILPQTVYKIYKRRNKVSFRLVRKTEETAVTLLCLLSKHLIFSSYCLLRSGCALIIIQAIIMGFSFYATWVVILIFHHIPAVLSKRH